MYKTVSHITPSFYIYTETKIVKINLISVVKNIFAELDPSNLTR